MSHLTDEARARTRAAQPTIDLGDNSLEAIVAANPARRTVLKNGLFGLSILPMLGALAACDDDDDDSSSPTPTPTPTPTPAPSYGITFAPVAANMNDTVTVPTAPFSAVYCTSTVALLQRASAHVISFSTPWSAAPLPSSVK